jgi:hypothetical protein
MNSTFKLHQKFSKDIIYLPIGYTNLFARSIVTFVSHHSELGIDENISLLQMSETLNRNFEKKIIFCFSGQKGKFWRTKAIEDFRRWNTSNSNFAIKINVRKGFSGTEGANGVTESVGLNYVQELLASRFVLCPPGNYSIYTFRFLESIVSGALPLYCYPCPSDPISSYTVLRSSITIFCDWAETLSKAVSWSDLQHARYRKELIRGFEMIFEEVNRKISHDIWT